MSENARRAFGAPLHRQVFLVIKNDILGGRYKPGDPLPGEEALSRLFDVSRITVRRALADLDAAQLIDRLPGKGTFVRALQKSSPAPMLSETGLGLEMAQVGQLPARLIEFGYVPASSEVAAALDLSPGEEVQRSVRVRAQGEVPVVHLTAYVPSVIGRTFSQEDLASTSLFEVLAQAGHPFVRSGQVLSAALAEPALARALNLDIGSAVLAISRTYFDPGERPVAYLKLRASPAHYQITMRFKIGVEDGQGSEEPMSYLVTMRP